MSILKNPLKETFSQIPNAIITDSRLSHSARLLYIYLASKPSNWVVRNSVVMEDLNIKDTHTMASLWKTLAESGWITRRKITPGADSQNTGTYEYVLSLDATVDHNAEKPQNGGDSIMGNFPIMWKNPTLNNTEYYHDSNNNITSSDNILDDNKNNLENNTEERKQKERVDAKQQKTQEAYSFKDFWNAYDKKVGRQEAEKLWKRLSERDKDKIRVATPLYVQSTPEQRFRKNPATYLRQRSWEDDIIVGNSSVKPYRKGDFANGRNLPAADKFTRNDEF